MAEKIRKIEFDYLYRRDTEKLAFFKLPKLLIDSEYFDDLDLGAKVLYSVCLDRASLSIKNAEENGSWTDEEGRIYIYYTIKDMQQDLRCSNKTAVKLKKQLVEKGLLIQKKQGLNKPDRLYVLDYSSSEDVRKCKKYTSGSVKITSHEIPESTLPEVKNSHSNNTDIKKTKRSSSSLKNEGINAWETIIDGRNRYSSNKNKLILDSLNERARNALKAVGGLTKLRNCDAFEEGRLKSLFIENYESQE